MTAPSVVIPEDFQRPRRSPRAALVVPELKLPAHHHDGPCGCEPSVAYIRVSSAAGRERIVSPEIQLKEIARYARDNGLRIIAIKFDLKSGKSTKGRKIEEIVAEIKAGQYRHVSLWKWSRWGRNTKESLEMIAAVKAVGGRVESAETAFNGHSPTDKMLRNFMLVQAEWQADIIGDTWRSTHKLRREAGLPHSGKDRFGYLYRDRRYWIIPAEAAVLLDAYDRYVKGVSLKQLTREWNAQGLFTMMGGQWTPQTLGKMLDTGFAAGYIRERSAPTDKPSNRITGYDVWRKGTHEAIISEDLWQAYRGKREAQAALPPRLRAAVHALSGLVFCGLCGRRMNTKYFGVPRVHNWVCHFRTPYHTEQNVCVSNKIAMDRVRGWIREFVVEADTQKSERADKVTADARETVPSVKSDADVCMERLAAIARRKKRLLAMSLASEEDDETMEMEFREAKSELDREEREIRIELARAKAQVSTNPEVFYPAFSALDAHWDDLLPSDHRDALTKVIGMVQVFPRESRRLADSPLRVKVVAAWEMAEWGDAWLAERRRWHESR